jgi:4-amino-4-deoxy-L-arabinose transferase-like glycosyltransferase
VWLAAALAWFLYFYRLSGVGMIGPDEPRYAAIGRAMAQSGDWITPRLWGQAWFEKPALLYWMTGAAFRLGLGPELAPRLPVALLSVAFLALYWMLLRREFGDRAAWMATLILGTSVAWVGFSEVGVTDLPLAATFSAAMLLAMPWVVKRETGQLPAAAAMLGLAVLAKGLVPLALAAPLAWRIRWCRDLIRLRVIGVFAAVVLPWYVLCYLRNGTPFLHDFFVVHHFQRFTSGGLQHVRPWWFYVPVLAALLLPWSPLVALAGRRSLYQDPRARFLAAWFLFGLAFLSAGTNKLPGYVLPLAPAIAALAGIGLDTAPRARNVLAACALLLIAFPIAAPIFPAAAANEWAGAPRVGFHWTWLLALAPAAAVWMLDLRGRRITAVAVIATGTAAGVAYLKTAAGPGMEQRATARALGIEVARHPHAVCLEEIRRDQEYGLKYYAGPDLPDCGHNSKPYRVIQAPGRPARLVAAEPGGTVRTNEKVDPQ